MVLDFCVVCGTKTDLHQHHIEPIVFSNVKRTHKKKNYDPNKKLSESTFIEIFAYLFDLGMITESGTITVCSYHHHLLHGIVKFQMAEHSTLIKRGLDKAREKGSRLGRPTNVTDECIDDVIQQYTQKTSIQKIATLHKIGVGTVYKILEEKGLK
jgi:hypothetical protein